ncbi:hemerythrin domain-containing protein [Streptomyces zhihengii]|uniref:hemerythrin domain-containing protein n=1 Tax=Streptomyces zhihengii TaxID=1818004 RepID=UPI003455D7C8
MGQGGNVIDELTADHRQVEDLFERIAGLAPGDPALRGLADELTRELVRHSVAEEEHFYPAVRRFVDDGDDMADKELADHAEIERMLKDLEDCPAEDSRFESLMGMVRTSVTTHVSDEEKRLFPLVVESCPGRILEELGERVRAARAKAPVQPHPSAPAGEASGPLAPGAGMVDRVRDMLVSRGGARG